MRHLRILHVISGLHVGGAEMMLLNLVRTSHQRADAHIVSLTADGPIGERLRGVGATTSVLGMRQGMPDPRAVFRVVREIRGFAPDVVQTWMHHADLIGGLAAAIARKPVVWGLHNAERRIVKHRWTALLAQRICAPLSYCLPSRIVSCGEKPRDYHVSVGYDPTKMVVIPNGFDLTSFRRDPHARQEVRQEFDIPPESLLVGMVARYHPVKDFQNFARAAGIVGRARPDSRFMLCGDGVTSANQELCGLLEQAGVLGRTTLLGRRADVPRIVAALDVFTLSSASEGFPTVIGEAMATEIPCVATDVGDTSLLVGDAGVVVPPHDPEALAAGWLQLLALSVEERLELGRRCRERIDAKFALPAVAENYMRIYEAVSRRS